MVTLILVAEFNAGIFSIKILVMSLQNVID